MPTSLASRGPGRALGQPSVRGAAGASHRPAVRYPRAVVLNAAQLSRPLRRPAALLALLLCSLFAAGPLATPALAQNSLVAPAQTKEEAEKEREAQEAADGDEGGGISIELGLGITGLILLGGAVAYMLRDARESVGGDERRAPEQAFKPSTVRGAPKTMFEGEARPGGQTGKAKKREKAKRQKHARRANRPR